MIYKDKLLIYHNNDSLYKTLTKLILNLIAYDFVVKANDIGLIINQMYVWIEEI